MKILGILKLLLWNQRGEVGFTVEGGASDPAASDPAASTGGDPASDPAPTTGDPKVTDPGTGEPAKIKVNYPDGLDETLFGNQTIQKFVDEKGNINYGNALKSLVHLQNNFGKDKITVPHKDFTDQQYSEFYDSVGRPPKEDYISSVSNNVPEGMKANEEMFNGFLEAAHSAGIMPKQAQVVIDYFNNQVKNEMETNENNFKLSYNDELDSLRKEWGSGFEKKQFYADTALKQFATEEEFAALEEKGFTKDLTLMKLFSKIGEGLGEESVFNDNTKQNLGITREEAQVRLTDMYKTGSPFMNKHHPQNEAAKTEFMRLQEIIHGNQKVSLT